MDFRFVTNFYLALLVSACSSSESLVGLVSLEDSESLVGSEDQVASTQIAPTERIEFFGNIEFYVNNSSEYVDLYAADFVRFSEEVNAHAVLAGYGALPDSCSYNDPDFFVIDDVTDSSVEDISAGETINLSSDSGTYGELVLNGDGFYTDETPLTHPFPVPLTVDIPGAEFRAMEGVQVPGISEVLGFELGNFDLVANVPLDTEIRWQAGNNDDVLVRITLFVNASQENGSTGPLYCTARDDGSFVIPESVRQQIVADGDPDSSAFPITFSTFGIPTRERAVVRLVSNSMLLINGVQVP